VKNTFKK